ncbi:hypothetical protein tinsulaeT_00440 [Thalassotalea insulae]|uniref:DUF3261 domain-containing protein n=1 Tax=Thalassotalea insulae TaxID=2056778 RepID=A0ABQ6GNF5_9GAMM|nr:hypothetical protein [Thalassotalea insulae]GLX76704.1 hypothetical protein tinsulaeT_00440 [Thalassotalea insulae]
MGRLKLGWRSFFAIIAKHLYAPYCGVILAREAMRKFIVLVSFLLLQGCTIYPGTYYAPISKVGEVISVGHCGDNSPSKLILKNDNVQVSAQAGDVHINYDQTWIWFEVESKDLFELQLLSENIAFEIDEKQVFPLEVSHFYRVSENEWHSQEIKALADIPKFSHKTNYFKLVFKFRKQKNISLRINELLINEGSLPIDVEFKTVEKIRISAINC